MKKYTHVWRVFAKAPDAKKGKAVFDFVLGINPESVWDCPLRGTKEFQEICARFPENTLFKIKEVKL